MPFAMEEDKAFDPVQIGLRKRITSRHCSMHPSLGLGMNRSKGAFGLWDALAAVVMAR